MMFGGIGQFAKHDIDWLMIVENENLFSDYHLVGLNNQLYGL